MGEPDTSGDRRRRVQRIGRIAAFVLPLPLVALPFVLDLRGGPVARLYGAAAGGFWYLGLFLGVKSAGPALAASGVYAYLLAAAGLNAVFGKRDVLSRVLVGVVVLVGVGLFLAAGMARGWNPD